MELIERSPLAPQLSVVIEEPEVTLPVNPVEEKRPQ